jgi:hypothetical protein
VVEWFEVGCILHNVLLSRDAGDWQEHGDIALAEAQEDKIHRLQERVRRVDEYRDVIDNEHEATREYLLARFKRLHRDVLLFFI